MNDETFINHLNQLQALEKKILSSKAEEYAHGDRLSNFYDAAEFNKTSPHDALWGMVTKHLIAVRDFIHGLDPDNLDVDHPEQWFEKLGDIRNYMMLLSAILYDTSDEYKEMFNDRTRHLHPMQATPTKNQSRQRRG